MDKTIDAIRKLFELLIQTYGPRGTLLIFAVGLAVSILWRYYNDRRKDKKVDATIREMDKTIQRLAEQERTLRIWFLKEKAGWTDEQVRQFVILNQLPKDAIEAREMLEDNKITKNKPDGVVGREEI